MDRQQLINEIVDNAERLPKEKLDEFLREAMMRIRDLDLYSLRVYAPAVKTVLLIVLLSFAAECSAYDNPGGYFFDSGTGVGVVLSGDPTVKTITNVVDGNGNAVSPGTALAVVTPASVLKADITAPWNVSPPMSFSDGAANSVAFTLNQPNLTGIQVAIGAVMLNPAICSITSNPSTTNVNCTVTGLDMGGNLYSAPLTVGIFINGQPLPFAQTVCYGVASAPQYSPCDSVRPLQVERVP